jgi:hypothetical protein
VEVNHETTINHAVLRLGDQEEDFPVLEKSFDPITSKTWPLNDPTRTRIIRVNIDQSNNFIPTQLLPGNIFG